MISLIVQYEGPFYLERYLVHPKDRRSSFGVIGNLIHMHFSSCQSRQIVSTYSYSIHRYHDPILLAARKYAIGLKHYLAQDLRSCAFIPGGAPCSETVEVEHGDRNHLPWMADSIARPRGRYIIGPIHISIWKEQLGALGLILEQTYHGQGQCGGKEIDRGGVHADVNAHVSQATETDIALGMIGLNIKS